MTEQECLHTLGEEGYKEVGVHTVAPDTHFGEHTHEQATVHIILEGKLILIEKEGIKILEKGERYEIPKGTMHDAKSGIDGVTFVVGVK